MECSDTKRLALISPLPSSWLSQVSLGPCALVHAIQHRSDIDTS